MTGPRKPTFGSNYNIAHIWAFSQFSHGNNRVSEEEDFDSNVLYTSDSEHWLGL